MVRSSSHRKRSRSRSPSPDHKRKSVRDYDKERIRRRSRSRDRLRRSRSRDRKNIKISESRVRSRPFKLKRRSRSRSKSKEKSSKKEEKKDSKPEEEPFDPTSLDKVPDDDDDVWVVTDTLEESLADDNGVMEEEYDYEADEDDQYSHASFPDKDGSLVEKIYENADDNPEQENENVDNPKDSTNCDKEENTPAVEKDTLKKDNGNDDNDGGKKETGDDNEEPVTKESEENPVEEGTSNVEKDSEEKIKSIKAERNPVKDLTNKVKDSCSTHRDKMKTYSISREANLMKNKSLFPNGPKTHVVFSEELVRLTKNQIRQNMKFDRELHETRMKHEIARHRAEVEVIRFQLSYWKKKLKH